MDPSNFLIQELHSELQQKTDNCESNVGAVVPTDAHSGQRRYSNCFKWQRPEKPPEPRFIVRGEEEENEEEYSDCLLKAQTGSRDELRCRVDHRSSGIQ